ncbi:hypothetical protein D5I55_10595 [Chakrabartia godavariana]|nr:hypothetical protein D5I55_10595 [Chakrabartia godavariana]
MAWSMTTLARLLAALTLVVAAFAIAPIADAAACGPEPLAAHQVIDQDPAAGDHGGSGEPGLCAHGHCHHTAGERHPSRDFVLIGPAPHVEHGRPLNDRLASCAPEGLKRPPRA